MDSGRNPKMFCKRTEFEEFSTCGHSYTFHNVEVWFLSSSGTRSGNIHGISWCCPSTVAPKKVGFLPKHEHFDDFNCAITTVHITLLIFRMFTRIICS